MWATKTTKKLQQRVHEGLRSEPRNQVARLICCLLGTDIHHSRAAVNFGCVFQQSNWTCSGHVWFGSPVDNTDPESAVSVRNNQSSAGRWVAIQQLQENKRM
jgi:hypothetical protein